ncbi:MAG TPA: peroxidase family protein [Blastocatellia bacterium]|nr:peroxidase family protein [Blastocatellia bacterium]
MANFFSKIFGRITEFVTGGIPWYKVPVPVGLTRVFRIREGLRANNLYDTGKVESIASTPLGNAGPAQKMSRTVDGTYNDLGTPRMGSAGARFGRNVPLDSTIPDQGALLTPSPRTVSLELMTRKQFQPATSLNLLAAAWIQFEVHDWMSHGNNEKEHPIDIPLSGQDPWPEPERPMQVRRTRIDPTRPPGSTNAVPTFANTETHWWDGSQIYGSDQETQTRVRLGVDGKLKIGSDNLLPLDPHTGIDISGVTGNWWVGLAMLHTLFTLEHNAIAERLRSEFGSWSDQELFDRARLINVALTAKIHTIEWTPAIIAHPTVEAGMNANWLTIRRSKAEHHAAPYSITEEFVAVYRMHPLMPDDLTFRAFATGNVVEELPTPDVLDTHARELMSKHSMADLFYSFGVMNPGAIRLHNFPRFMQRLVRTTAPTIDLATVDILRDRERGVPRYNEFLRLIDKDPVKKFEDLSSNKEWVEEIRRVYNNEIDKVDLMVGLYAEDLPEGFGFSETAFRIFILMASRRLQSDRFFTTDYNEKTYTKVGLDWIENNNMRTVLRRHIPQLGPLVDKLGNAFKPWPKK